MKSRIRHWNKRRLRKRRLAQIAARFDQTTRQQFASAGLAVPNVRILGSDAPVGGNDIILRRENGGITALFNAVVDPAALADSHNKLAAYLHWFDQASDDVREIIVDASDGDKPSAARYRFSSASAQDILLPDAHFFRDHGYAQTDRLAAEQPVAWEARSDRILWRGRLNNNGLFALDPGLMDNPAVKQRLRMALKCKGSDVDFRFVAEPRQRHDRLLHDADLIGGYIPVEAWNGMKYAVDIDGYTNAWCNFMQRLKLGCCVFKVESPFGFRQWYYPKLTPWEHYVPIRADLSDLAEQVDRVRADPTLARGIAQAGQALARSLSFETETRFAAAAIEQGGGP